MTNTRNACESNNEPAIHEGGTKAASAGYARPQITECDAAIDRARATRLSGWVQPAALAASLVVLLVSAWPVGAFPLGRIHVATHEQPSSAYPGTTLARVYELSLQADAPHDRPLVIVEGIDLNADPYGGTQLQSVLDQMGPMADQLLMLGYDLFIVDFRSWSYSLEILTEGLIEYFPTIWDRTKKTHRIKLLGASAGGVLARHALGLMEQRGIDHHTNLLMTLDSPHKGAVIPVALQHTLSFWANQLSVVEEMYEPLKSWASVRQLLVRWYQPYPTNPFIEFLRVDDGAYREFQRKYALVIPQQARRVAFANGSYSGKPHNPDAFGGATMFKFEIDEQPWGRILAQVSSLPVNAGRPQLVSRHVYRTGPGAEGEPAMTNGLYGNFNIENAPGGFRSSYKEISDAVMDAVAILGLPEDVEVPPPQVLGDGAHCFIPTSSALDWNVDYSQRDAFYVNGGRVTDPNTPISTSFDIAYGDLSDGNREHVNLVSYGTDLIAELFAATDGIYVAGAQMPSGGTLSLEIALQLAQDGDVILLTGASPPLSADLVVTKDVTITFAVSAEQGNYDLNGHSIVMASGQIVYGQDASERSAHIAGGAVFLVEPGGRTRAVYPDLEQALLNVGSDETALATRAEYTVDSPIDLGIRFDWRTGEWVPAYGPANVTLRLDWRARIVMPPNGESSIYLGNGGKIDGASGGAVSPYILIVNAQKSTVGDILGVFADPEKALAVSQPGQTVQLGPGRYPMARFVAVDESVIGQLNGNLAERTIVEFGQPLDYEHDLPLVFHNQIGAMFKDVEFHFNLPDLDPEQRLFRFATSPGGENKTEVINCVFLNVNTGQPRRGKAVEVEYSAGQLKISRCLFKNFGVGIDILAPADALPAPLVKGCILDGNAIGMRCPDDAQSFANVQCNDFFDNTVALRLGVDDINTEILVNAHTAGGNMMRSPFYVNEGMLDFRLQEHVPLEFTDPRLLLYRLRYSVLPPGLQPGPEPRDANPLLSACGGIGPAFGPFYLGAKWEIEYRLTAPSAFPAPVDYKRPWEIWPPEIPTIGGPPALIERARIPPDLALDSRLTMPVPLATQPGPISPLTLEVRNAGVPLSLRDPKEVVVRFDVSGHTFMRFTAGELAQAGGAVTKTLVPDVLPPPAVPAFTAKRTAAATAVSWSPVKDPAVAGALSSGIMGYKVIRQTNPLIQVGSVGPADTSFVDSPFMPGAVYYVLAYDSAGNNSLSSWTFVDGDYTKWSKSTAITLNTRPSGADVAQDVAEFPLLVTLDAHNFPFGEARADGGDLRFSTPEGEPLSYEIETYSRDAQRAEIWVLTPLVQGDAQREAIVMHWGNEYATDQSTHDAVFARSNGFVAVWHMAPPRPPCGPEAKRPWCNYGHALRCAHDGLDSVIDLWDQQQGDRLSVSMFHALYRQLTDKGNTGHAAVEPCAQCRHGQHAARYAQFTLSWWARAAGTWHFYAFVCDRGRELFYVDGKQAGRSQFRCVASDEIDEIWISSVARSPAWIRLCWENRRDGQRLVVLGPAEAGSAGCLPVSAQVHVHRPRDR